MKITVQLDTDTHQVVSKKEMRACIKNLETIAEREGRGKSEQKLWCSDYLYTKAAELECILDTYAPKPEQSVRDEEAFTDLDYKLFYVRVLGIHHHWKTGLNSGQESMCDIARAIPRAAIQNKGKDNG